MDQLNDHLRANGKMERGSLLQQKRLEQEERDAAKTPSQRIRTKFLESRPQGARPKTGLYVVPQHKREDTQMNDCFFQDPRERDNEDDDDSDNDQQQAPAEPQSPRPGFFRQGSNGFASPRAGYTRQGSGGIVSSITMALRGGSDHASVSTKDSPKRRDSLKKSNWETKRGADIDALLSMLDDSSPSIALDESSARSTPLDASHRSCASAPPATSGGDKSLAESPKKARRGGRKPAGPFSPGPVKNKVKMRRRSTDARPAPITSSVDLWTKSCSEELRSPKDKDESSSVDPTTTTQKVVKRKPRTVPKFKGAPTKKRPDQTADDDATTTTASTTRSKKARPIRTKSMDKANTAPKLTRSKSVDKSITNTPTGRLTRSRSIDKSNANTTRPTRSRSIDKSSPPAGRTRSRSIDKSLASTRPTRGRSVDKSKAPPVGRTRSRSMDKSTASTQRAAPRAKSVDKKPRPNMIRSRSMDKPKKSSPKRTKSLDNSFTGRTEDDTTHTTDDATLESQSPQSGLRRRLKKTKFVELKKKIKPLVSPTGATPKRGKRPGFKRISSLGKVFASTNQERGN